MNPGAAVAKILLSSKNNGLHIYEKRKSELDDFIVDEYDFTLHRKETLKYTGLYEVVLGGRVFNRNFALF